MRSNNNPLSEGLKAYTISELAGFYGISPKVFVRWLKPHEEKIGKREGRYYNVMQVQYILRIFGTPGNVENNS